MYIPQCITKVFSLLFLTCILLTGCKDEEPSCEPVDVDMLSEFTDSLRANLAWPSDLKINAFSGPDLTPSPACLAVAPTGEVFVGVDKIGSLGKEMGQGQIVRFVDCNQDGIPDSYTVFATVDNPRGIIAIDDQVFVLHTTFSTETEKADGMDLVVFEDKDRDGIADGPPQVLIENICSEKFLRERGTDHATNGIRMGIDGWIYIAVGDFGFHNARDREGTTLTQLGGGIVRVRPDGTGMEVYTHGLRNIYDVAIDPFMNIFTRGNTNDGGGWNIRFSDQIQSGEYGYPVLFKHFTEEIIPAMVDLGGGSGTGAMYMDDDRWPDKYNDVPMMADWGRSYLYMHHVTPSGGSFTQEEENFIQLPQITDVDLDASGIMYLSAWDGAGYSGSPDKGYTVRVIPDGMVPAPYHSLSRAPLSELIRELQSGSAVARQYASFMIVKRFDKKSASKVWDLVSNAGLDVKVRVAAMYTYAQIADEASMENLVSLAQDPVMEEHALRAMTDRMNSIGQVPVEPYLQGLKNKNDRVEAAAIIGLGRMGRSEAVPALLEIKVPDSFVAPEIGTEGPHATPNAGIIPAHLAVKSLVRINDVDALLDAVEQNQNALAMWALRYIHDSDVTQRLMKIYNESIDSDFRNKITVLLARQYHEEAPYDGSWWWSTRPDTHGPYYKGIEWESSPLIRDFLVEEWRNSSGAVKDEFKLLNSKFRLGIEQFGELEVKEPKEDLPIADLEKIQNRKGEIGRSSIEDVMLALDRIKGDVDEGAKLFVSQGCQTCHNLKREDVMKGPYMGQIGSIMNREQIAESILKPNASISQGFSTVQIRTEDEKIYVGFVTEESADELTIRNIAGIPKTLKMKDIKERKEMESSMMPAGLANALSYKEFASLVDFLKSQTQ